jgi:hypothetical protein
MSNVVNTISIGVAVVLFLAMAAVSARWAYQSWILRGRGTSCVLGLFAVVALGFAVQGLLMHDHIPAWLDGYGEDAQTNWF